MEDDVVKSLTEIDYLISSICLDFPGLDEDLLVLHEEVFSLRALFLGLIDTIALRIIVVEGLNRVVRALDAFRSERLKYKRSTIYKSASCAFVVVPTASKRLRQALSTLEKLRLTTLRQLRPSSVEASWPKSTKLELQSQASRSWRRHMPLLVRKRMQSSSQYEPSQSQVPTFFPELNGNHPVLKFLTTSRTGVCVAGIVGQGGVGKTALLVHILQELRNSTNATKYFPFITYVELVGNSPNDEELLKAQASLLLQLGGVVSVQNKSLIDGRSALSDRFQELVSSRQSICMAIDNVWVAQNLKAFVPEVMFKPSVTLTISVCIVLTSRMHNTVDAVTKEVWGSDTPCDVLTFEQKPMPRSAARKLLQALINPASASGNPPDMVDDIWEYCGGLPLALKAAGDLLSQAKFDSWVDFRRTMGRTFTSSGLQSVQGILEKSFRNLQSSSQEALCDVAFFLHGWKWDIVQSIIGVQEMNELSILHLIEVVHQNAVNLESSNSVSNHEGGNVIMHNLIRELALERRVKPWDAEMPSEELFGDVRFPNCVRYLRLNEEDFKVPANVPPTLPLCGRCFALMPRLRVLELFGSFKWRELHLPDGLLYLRLANNQLLKQLSDVQVPSNLRHFELELNVGLLELPLSIYDCTNLQSLRICGCPNLRGFKSVSCWKSLTKLHLASCLGITQLPTGLEALRLLSLHGCMNLQNLPALPSTTIIDIRDCRRPVPASQVAPVKVTTMMPSHTCGKVIKVSSDSTQLSLQDCTCQKVEGLEAFKNLRKIKLQFCQSLVELPDSICRLESLVVLDLHGCSQLQQLPMGMGMLNLLEILDLRDCKRIRSLPKSIFCLTLLKELNLSGCGELEELPEEIGGLISLRVMRLAKCERLTVLPYSICNLDSLVQLDLHGCKKLKELPEDIGNLKSFETLFLIECHNITVLPESICRLTSLTALYMNECSQLHMLPEDMGSLKKLKVLSLVECSRLTQLCDSICSLDSLVMLDLQGCLMLENLPEKFGNLRSLEALSLMECQGLKSLPYGICRLETLKDLDLSVCLKLEELPDNMGNLSLLQKLTLANCEVLKRLPDSVCSLHSLVMLDLHGCYMMEELPMLFHKLSALETLNLVNCRSLKLPLESFKGFMSLRELDMRGSLAEKDLGKEGLLYLVGCKNIERFLMECSEKIDYAMKDTPENSNGKLSMKASTCG